MRKAQGLYIISVAAQILEMHPQTLRKYERAGFVEPPRMGTLRLYSEDDIARLRLIKYLVDELGLNLSGVEMSLDLLSKLLDLRSKLDGPADQRMDRAALVRDVDDLLLKLGLKLENARAWPEPAPPQDIQGRPPAKQESFRSR